MVPTPRSTKNRTSKSHPYRTQHTLQKCISEQLFTKSFFGSKPPKTIPTTRKHHPKMVPTPRSTKNRTSKSHPHRNQHTLQKCKSEWFFTKSFFGSKPSQTIPTTRKHHPKMVPTPRSTKNRTSKSHPYRSQHTLQNMTKSQMQIGNFHKNIFWFQTTKNHPNNKETSPKDGPDI